MKILEKSDATGSLAEYTADIEKEPVIVTSDGIPIAALVPIGNVDLETMSLSTNAVFIALIERSRTRHRTEGGISSDEMRHRMRDSERA
jgi:antitoxin (DNA-binding transcriptional repressor) of toxin-antitoxin stability system